MKITPLHPHAALLLEDEKKYVIVSDLHIGLESELDGKGITFRSSIVQNIQDELLSLVESEKAYGLVLLGDIKNTVGSISRQEWGDIPGFFKALSSKTNVYLVPGNHDGNIRHLVPDNINVINSRGMVICDALLVHGHSLPSDFRSHIKHIVMGHLHPVFLKRDSVVNGERVWVYLQVKKEALFAESGVMDIVIMPIFNRYPYAANEKVYRKSTSPIISRVKKYKNAVQKCMVFTLDGSIVGDSSVLQYIL